MGTFDPDWREQVVDLQAEVARLRRENLDLYQRVTDLWEAVQIREALWRQAREEVRRLRRQS
jgi:hypothetical protein